ncbi:MAG: MarR family transcriptional regulator [Ahrensia sp.]|nr:MarR family transcriptional regulator [Ahrensia sp.]
MPGADESLRHLTGYQLRRTTSAAMPGVNKVLEKFGLRRSTYSSLVVIVTNPGLNQVQLAGALAIERPNLVQIVDQLEQAGLVRREKSKDDRRAYSLLPTSKGCEIQKRATKALKRFDDLLKQGLSEPEIEFLHQRLKVIEENAEKMEVQGFCDVPST